MMKGLIVDDNMSNLTFASGEISASSSTRNESAANLYPPQQSSASTTQSAPPPPKKKRSLPGNPDPDAEVMALSPKTLLATNRFICEICNKGFQRDQNLQLHRRGHNLPWKLKQRSNKEVVRKKVYVCPEPTCVHHDPSRALGDLTGIKKHFFRKHGEKKWKCEKCSKRYAVQSDWKAHSKICGTREYRCDCGTLFSRRDSFITHRAFCDALAQETSTNTVRAMSGTLSNSNPLLLSSSQPPLLLPPQLDNSQFGGLNSLVKREVVQEVNVPPWLSPPPPLFSAAAPPNNSVLDHHSFIQHHHHQMLSQKPNPSPAPPSAFASATALLQKAAQMGATMSSNNRSSTNNNTTASPFFKPHQLMSSESISSTSLGPNAAVSAHQMFMEGSSTSTNHDFEAAAHSSLVHDMMSSLQTSTAPMGPGNIMAGTPSFVDQAASAGGGNFLEVPSSRTGSSTTSSVVGGHSSSNNNNEELTRDFLGLRTFPTRRDQFFNIVGLDQHMNSTGFGDQKHHSDQTPWQG